MVGLPARGKTFIARKIARYLSWLGYRTQVFNVGSYRRERHGSRQHHSFFDPRNDAGQNARRDVALEALDDMLAFLKDGGDVAIYDATNNTRERRDLVQARCEAAGMSVVFVESICNDPAIIEANIRANKARSPDYEGVARGGGGARLPPAHRPLPERLRGGGRGRGPLREDHRRGPHPGAPPRRRVPAGPRRPLPAQPARPAAQRAAHPPRRERVQRARPDRRRLAPQRGGAGLRAHARLGGARARGRGRRRLDQHPATDHRDGRGAGPAATAPGAPSTRSTPASATA